MKAWGLYLIKSAWRRFLVERPSKNGVSFNEINPTLFWYFLEASVCFVAIQNTSLNKAISKNTNPIITIISNANSDKLFFNFFTSFFIALSFLSCYYFCKEPGAFAPGSSYLSNCIAISSQPISDISCTKSLLSCFTNLVSSFVTLVSFCWTPLQKWCIVQQRWGLMEYV